MDIPTIKGQKLTRAHTLGSHYDNNCIVFTGASGQQFRMDVSEIFKLQKSFNDTKFKIVKKRVYNYLEII